MLSKGHEALWIRSCGLKCLKNWERQLAFSPAFLAYVSDLLLWTSTSLYPTDITKSLCKTLAIYVWVGSAGCSRIPRQWRFFSATWYNHRQWSWACCRCCNMDHDVSHGAGSDLALWNATHFRQRWRSHMCCLCKDLPVSLLCLRSL